MGLSSFNRARELAKKKAEDKKVEEVKASTPSKAKAKAKTKKED